MTGHPLNSLMKPRSIAVLGASPREGAPGNTVIRNLIAAGYPGEIHPVHPVAAEVLGLPASQDLDAIGTAPECVVVCLSAEKVVPALEVASATGVRAAVVFASGFAEAGKEGEARQTALRSLSDRTGLLVCGPNCLGLANITDGIPLYSAALPDTLEKGDVAILSHSGSGCIVLSSLGRFGVSHMVSVGNGAVVDVDAYLDYLADDPATRVAALFIETVRNPSAFAAAVSRMRRAGKHVVALKVGRSEKGALASAAHTGSLSATSAVYDDFFKSCGVISVDDIDELAESVVLLRALRTRPQGKGVAIMNVSGGEVALTCDIAQQVGLELPPLTNKTQRKLSEVLPSFATVANPLDATGVAVFDMDMYGACVRALAEDENIAVVAVSQDCPTGLGVKQAETYRAMTKTIAALAPTLSKPVIFYNNVAGGVHPRVEEPLTGSEVPALQGARASLLSIRRMLDTLNASAGLAEPVEIPAADPKWVRRFSLASGPLTERESKAFLAEAGLPITRELLATTAEEARRHAETLSYPVVLKIESPDLPHKSDVGGVKLNLHNGPAVESAFREIMDNVARNAPSARISGILVQEMIQSGVEVIAGVNREPPFGMSLVFGAGGVLVELLRDSALAIAPVSQMRAAELVSHTRISKLLRGYRGAPAADVDALCNVLSRLSAIAVAYGDVIEAIDLNPIYVLARGQGLRIADALVVPRARVADKAGE